MKNAVEIKSENLIDIAAGSTFVAVLTSNDLKIQGTFFKKETLRIPLPVECIGVYAGNGFVIIHSIRNLNAIHLFRW
jgi:hypothetical protein